MSKFTAQHYKIIAPLLAQSRTVEGVRQALAEMFAEDNPHFLKSHFMAESTDTCQKCICSGKYVQRLYDPDTGKPEDVLHYCNGERNTGCDWGERARRADRADSPRSRGELY